MIGKIIQNFAVEWMGRSGKTFLSPFRFTEEKADQLCRHMKKLTGQRHSYVRLPWTVESPVTPLKNHFGFNVFNEDGDVIDWTIEMMEQRVGVRK